MEIGFVGFLVIFFAGVGTGWVFFEKPEWVRQAYAWVKSKF